MQAVIIPATGFDVFIDIFNAAINNQLHCFVRNRLWNSAQIAAY